MKLINLPLKNAFQNWWRSLTLGSFLLFASLLFVFFNSIVFTIKSNVEEALVYSLVGDVQIRTAPVKQDDIVALDADWGVNEYLSADKVNDVKQVLKEKIGNGVLLERVRNNAVLTYETQKVPSMIIGLDTGFDFYQRDLKLKKGNYLDPGGAKQIVLSEKLADQLKADVGEKINVMAQTVNKETAAVELTVVGIGNLQRLSGYGTDICYMDIESARLLKGLKKDEASDIIVYTSETGKASSYAQKLNSFLNKDGKFTVTSWNNQGGYIRTVNMIYIVMFYVFIGILLFIICILIMNMVFMIALERRQEIGALRAIGFNRLRIVFLFMFEIFLVALLFCGIGAAIGSGASLFLAGKVIQTGPPWDGILGDKFVMKVFLVKAIPGLVAMLAVTCLSALYPSLKAASVRPADILNEK